jgi:hypothetical protein
VNRLFDRPTTLSPDRRDAVESRARETEIRLLDAVERVLADVQHEAQRDLLYASAFEGTTLLTKRESRPKLELGYLLEQLCLAADLSTESTNRILEVGVCVSEYFDVLDDVVDGDVEPGRDGEAVALAQVLVPMFVERLAELGADAAAFWSDTTRSFLTAPYLETQTEPSLAAYRRIVDRQSGLFGCVTGLPAVVADADGDAVERATAIGEHWYAYEQFLLDGEQHARESSPWNLWVHATEPEALAILEETRNAYELALDDLPDSRARALEPLVAHDLDEWVDSR